MPGASIPTCSAPRSTATDAGSDPQRADRAGTPTSCAGRSSRAGISRAWRRTNRWSPNSGRPGGRSRPSGTVADSRPVGADSSGRPERLRVRRRRRARAHHSERLARTDHLSRRRAALDRGTRHSGRELTACDRAVGGQVLHDRAAAAGRPSCSRNRRLRARRRRDGRDPPDAGPWRRGDRQADLRIDGPRPRPHRRRRSWRGAWSGRSSRCEPVFYVQRAIDHGGRDVRLFVVGGRVRRCDRADRAAGRLAHERCARRDRASDRSLVGVAGVRDRSGAAPSAPTMPAWTCSSSRTGETSTCWK